MYKWIKVIIILMIFGTFLGACANNPEQGERTQDVEVEAPAGAESPTNESSQTSESGGAVEAPIVTENSTSEFPQTLGYTAQPPVVDPAKGYFVGEIADGIYWLSGSQYQTMFLTTGEGVIAIDAPQPIGGSYLEAIKEVTDEPITHVIYSHAHNDHIGAAGMFPPDIEYIGPSRCYGFFVWGSCANDNI